MARVVPFPDQVVLEEYLVANRTEGGIIMPDAKLPHNIGTFIGRVTAVGEDIKKVKVGDIIVTHKGKLWQLPLLTKMFWLAKEESLGAWIFLDDADEESAFQKTDAEIKK